LKSQEGTIDNERYEKLIEKLTLAQEREHLIFVNYEGELKQVMNFDSETGDLQYNQIFFKETNSTDNENIDGEEESTDVPTNLKDLLPTKCDQNVSLSVHSLEPQSDYNSTHIPFADSNYVQSISKLSIQSPGNYIISIHQKNPALYPEGSRRANLPICITLGQILEGNIAYTSHQAFRGQKTTNIGPFYLEEGPYVLLLEMDCKGVNQVYESDWLFKNPPLLTQTNAQDIKRSRIGENLQYWRDSVIGVEGVNGDWCRIDSLAMEKKR
jgi:hypothetical protein